MSTIECRLERSYTRSCSFETLNSPFTFQSQWKPNDKLEIKVNWATLKKNIHEVSLILDLTMKSEETLAYHAKAQQIGIFTFASTESLEVLFNTLCPTQLCPYAVERLNSFITHAGFLPLSIAPINFEALYAQKSKEDRREETKLS
jgi:preprotein translocase subunit SecB